MYFYETVKIPTVLCKEGPTPHSENKEQRRGLVLSPVKTAGPTWQDGLLGTSPVE